MEHKLDQETIYYFLAPNDDRYYTLFIAWIQEELIIALMQKEADQTVRVKNQVGEHTFISVFDGPVYLLEREKEIALAYAGDDGKLELFPSGNGPELIDTPPIINYPTYWTKGIEPMLEWKFSGNLFRQTNGVWVPVTIKR